MDTLSPFQNRSLEYLGNTFFPDKGSSILDIGSGNGHSLLPLHNAGWKNLWALDRDEFNKDFFLDRNISFACADVNRDTYPFEDNFFDVIISFHLIEHLNNPHNFLLEARRALKQGGIFFIVTPDWRKQYKTFWRDHTHVHPYDKESISRLLRSYEFSDISVKSFGLRQGLGRFIFWKFFPGLYFTGLDIIALCFKKI